MGTKERKRLTIEKFQFRLEDVIKSILILFVFSCVGVLFDMAGLSASNIIMVYILGVLITAITTSHQIYSLISSFVSVIVFNFFFTEPKFTLLAYDKDYPVTFAVMFLAAFMTGSLAVRLKWQAKLSAQAAYRTRQLLDMNQLLESVRDESEIISVTVRQLKKLLHRDVTVYMSEDGAIEEVIERLRHTRPEYLTYGKSQYFPIHMKEQIYAVAGIAYEEKQLDDFEKSILLSILSECALALENEKNRREKEAAAILAEKEQLRANLLRSISHDLRTPLTSISGNASNLLSNEEKMDTETKLQIYRDIYSDSMWLINLVENLLSVTRIEEGRIELHQRIELMDEVIAEALQHTDKHGKKHTIVVEKNEELLFARMDAKLIVQVLINLIDNAEKYTPAGTQICILTKRDKDRIRVSVKDNGPGIGEDVKPHLFEMFYSGANMIADSRRSLGLGLCLCESIIHAHGGKIEVLDNEPQGTIVTFTLPIGDVKIHAEDIDFGCRG